VLRKLLAPRFNNALPQELKSGYATQSLLDYVFRRRNDSGFGVTAVVGSGCHRSDRLPLLVGGVPQRLVLILDSLLVGLPEISKSTFPISAAFIRTWGNSRMGYRPQAHLHEKRRTTLSRRFKIEYLLHTPSLWHYTLDPSRCIKLGASFAIARLLK
jgi:hypothetical protein